MTNRLRCHESKRYAFTEMIKNIIRCYQIDVNDLWKKRIHGHGFTFILSILKWAKFLRFPMFFIACNVQRSFFVMKAKFALALLLTIYLKYLMLKTSFWISFLHKKYKTISSQTAKWCWFSRINDVIILKDNPVDVIQLI